MAIVFEVQPRHDRGGGLYIAHDIWKMLLGNSEALSTWPQRRTFRPHSILSTSERRNPKKELAPRVPERFSEYLGTCSFHRRQINPVFGPKVVWINFISGVTQSYWCVCNWKFSSASDYMFILLANAVSKSESGSSCVSSWHLSAEIVGSDSTLGLLGWSRLWILWWILK